MRLMCSNMNYVTKAYISFHSDVWVSINLTSFTFLTEQGQNHAFLKIWLHITEASIGFFSFNFYK